MTKQDLYAYVTKAYDKPFTLKIQKRMYKLTYKHIGILFDKEATARTAFEGNTAVFPYNFTSYIHSYFSQKMLYPGLIFSQDFVKFAADSRFDFTNQKDEVVIDNANKTLNFQDNEELYRIDAAHLKTLIMFGFGEDNQVFEPRLIRIVHTEKQETINAQNKKIEEIYAKPVTVLVQDKDQFHSIELKTSDLKKLFDVRYEEGEVSIIPNVPYIKQTLEDKIDPLISRTEQIDMQGITQNVLSIFTSRLKGFESGPLVAKTSVKEPTHTNGTLAERYIEISISQQKMYLFNRGSVVGSYVVSTGLYYPTPVGEFTIMNKALEGYSDIFNVYMPYWMAFHYGWAGGQDAYFGIHELPYWYVGDERKQRPREFLGSPHTGGCVSLDIGAAKEVYDFSYVGMRVVIFE